jgi:D-alanine-D-alanine ligase
VLVNELNTLPGMTPTSAFPKLWEAAGVPWPQAIERLLQIALARHRAERAHTH